MNAAVRLMLLALCVALLGATPAAAAITVIDRFDDLDGWRAQPADGVELTLHTDSGRAGM